MITATRFLKKIVRRCFIFNAIDHYYVNAFILVKIIVFNWHFHFTLNSLNATFAYTY
jgi:hypothetical protein